MVRKEIDLLLRAAVKHCMVVEKTTNLAWGEEELREAAAAGLFQQPDQIGPPDRCLAVTGPFPSCGRQTGAGARVLDTHRLGQTTHFVLFRALGVDGPAAR